MIRHGGSLTALALRLPLAAPPPRVSAPLASVPLAAPIAPHLTIATMQLGLRGEGGSHPATRGGAACNAATTATHPRGCTGVRQPLTPLPHTHAALARVPTAATTAAAAAGTGGHTANVVDGLRGRWHAQREPASNAAAAHATAHATSDAHTTRSTDAAKATCVRLCAAEVRAPDSQKRGWVEPNAVGAAGLAER